MDVLLLQETHFADGAEMVIKGYEGHHRSRTAGAAGHGGVSVYVHCDFESFESDRAVGVGGRREGVGEARKCEQIWVEIPELGAMVGSTYWSPECPVEESRAVLAGWRAACEIALSSGWRMVTGADLNTPGRNQAPQQALPPEWRREARSPPPGGG